MKNGLHTEFTKFNCIPRKSFNWVWKSFTRSPSSKMDPECYYPIVNYLFVALQKSSNVEFTFTQPLENSLTAHNKSENYILDVLAIKGSWRQKEGAHATTRGKLVRKRICLCLWFPHLIQMPISTCVFVCLCASESMWVCVWVCIQAHHGFLPQSQRQAAKTLHCTALP